MKLIISTLTPIHIGSGGKYSAAEFLIKGNQLYRVDINKLFGMLDERSKEDFIIQLEEPYFQLGSFLRGKNIEISRIKRYSCNLKAGYPAEINEHVKTNGGAFIPGSSIKGSIRTAILYNLIEKKDIDRISKMLDLKYWQRDREVQKFIDNFFSGKTKELSSYSSFLRFLQITDTNTISNVSVYSIKVANVERGGGVTWYKRRGREVTLFNETIDVNENLGVEISEHYNPNIYKDLRLGEKERLINLDKIIEDVYIFSADLIEHELEFAEKYHMDFLKNFYEQLKSKNTKDSPLLRLGHGSGYLATTIGLKLKRYPNVFEKVRRSLRGKSYPYEFPKTRKIVFENGKPSYPLGWVKIYRK